ncbi:hypothetical protein [Janibacter melonis]|uniref:hypothetical protein n=1 Tax=Janibacter melonis TaxID=262209 RepID=UPI0017810216|nr:hypothetical protein [Janibacter melonis]
MPDQGETYTGFIEAELKAEHERRGALDGRAAGIATTSSAFLALVFTVSALVTGKDYRFTDWGARGAVLALLLFAAAALSGLVATVAGRGYHVVSVPTLRDMVGSHWVDDEVDARNVTASSNVETIFDLRVGNNLKARLIVVGLGLQVAATFVLICALGWELKSFVLP